MYPSIDGAIREVGIRASGNAPDQSRKTIANQGRAIIDNSSLLGTDLANEANNMMTNGIERKPDYESQYQDTHTMDTRINEISNIQMQSDNSKVMTHGFVHGHIHKHKDHTHIHGHIHNHDHDHHRRKVSSADPTLAEDDCKEFEEDSFCKDIFCDDLDDCFFLTCDDNKDKDQNVHECEHDHSHHEINTQQDLPVPIQQVDKLSVDNLDDYTPQHQNHLCDTQLSKKPIFENLISNVHKNLTNITFPSQKFEDSYDSKRRKLNDFEIHFPHECHQEESIEQTPQMDDHHHFHQSCFHTTIPNSNTPDPLAESEKIMSDFDFYIQFNNFNQYLNNINQKNPQNLDTQNFEYLNNNLIPQSTVPSSILSNLLQDSSNSTTPSPSPPQYSCRWDNCFRKVNDGTLMQHLINQHIDQEYQKNIDTQSINPKKMSYQCEWNDCNYMDHNLDSLIDHLTVHRDEFNANQLMRTPNYALTPKSTDKSVNSSPDINDSFVNQKFNLKSETPTDHSYIKHDREIKAENAKDDDLLENLHITSMKIMPKRKSCNKEHDPHFTCKWEVIKDGESVPCNKTYTCEGELQDHLVNDHVGAGKSSYECGWIGCDRFHGKKFVQRQKLLRHIYIHTNFKPCKCDKCGASFAVESMLKQHLRVHSGEKPFLCRTCGKRFATSSSLSIHNRVHTGERPLVCKWKGCNKRFRESSNLTKHMKIHLKSFKCEVCGDEFNKKPDYTKHLKENTCTANETEESDIRN